MPYLVCTLIFLVKESRAGTLYVVYVINMLHIQGRLGRSIVSSLGVQLINMRHIDLLQALLLVRVRPITLFITMCTCTTALHILT